MLLPDETKKLSFVLVTRLKCLVEVKGKESNPKVKYVLKAEIEKFGAGKDMRANYQPS